MDDNFDIAFLRSVDDSESRIPTKIFGNPISENVLKYCEETDANAERDRKMAMYFCGYVNPFETFYDREEDLL